MFEDSDTKIIVIISALFLIWIGILGYWVYRDSGFKKEEHKILVEMCKTGNDGACEILIKKEER